MTDGASPSWPGGPQVQLRRWMPVSAERAFQSFTDPALLRQWWRPRGFTIEQVDFSAREGDEYRVRLRAPDGTWFAHTGTFLRVVPSTELVFTWRWVEGPLDPAETLVEVSFTPDRNGVWIEVTHSRFASDAERDRHTGWTDALDALEHLLTRGAA